MRWLPIPGYEGRYDVSDQGQIRSWLGWNGTSVPRILKPGKGRGQLHVTLRLDGRSIEHKVHHLVMLAFVGPRPEHLETRHLDGDHTNNARTNLAYGTGSENNLDAVRHGTHHNASKTHCKQGHPFDDANTKWYRDRRICRACNRDAVRRSAARKAAAIH